MPATCPRARSTEGGLNPEDRDVITSIAKGNPAAMASFSGYTDLLLNESEGKWASYSASFWSASGVDRATTLDSG